MASLSSSASDDAVVIDRDDISNYNPEQILPETPEEIKKIRAWLDSTDYSLENSEYSKHKSSHMPGTGAWLTSSTAYCEWLNKDEQGMLWIKGVPGSGKSVVAAHLVDELSRSNPGVPVLYFFFRQIIDANHEPAALLRDWLDQVLDYSPPLQKQLKELVKARRSLSSMSMEDLWKSLRLALAGLPGKAFCVADALDEMDHGNDEFLRSLAAFGQWKPNRVKLLITSRPVPCVEEPLRRAETLHIRLVEKMVDVDISHYVERGLQSSMISKDDQSLIKEAIPGRANGLFLYARLAMDAFLEPGAHTRIRDILQTLPADLHDMYTDLLHEHARRSGVPDDIQLLILQWVTHATRPLRLLELAEMINVTYRKECERDLKKTKDLVRAAVGPLLEILPDETVCVIHHSFTEYLKCMTRSENDGGYPVLRQGMTHGRLALACLRYMQSGCLDLIKVPADNSGDAGSETEPDPMDIMGYGSSMRNSGKNEKEEKYMRLRYPFLAYAAANWYVHITRSTAAGYPQNEINAALDGFFKTPHRMKAWLKIQWSGEDGGSKSITPMHIAAKFGLTEYLRTLVTTSNADIHAGDTCGKTPLWWAATSGHASIIRILVRAGADPDVDDRLRGLKPLHEAASENHADAVRALLEAGVNPLTKKTRENPGRMCGNAPRTNGHTPLMYTCQNGHLEALEAFLPFLEDLDTVHRALIWSTEKGRSKLVHRILRHPGVDVNAKVRGCTALFVACSMLARDTIAALIDAGADPAILCDNWYPEFGGIGSGYYWHPGQIKDETRGYTALYALCGGENRRYGTNESLNADDWQDLFSLLIQKGANIHQRTDDGSTALHAAVNNPILVRLLLDAGAEPDALTDRGCAPIHTLTSPDSLSLLVEEGNVDIDRIYSYERRSPILCMLGNHHRGACLKLLEYKPNLTLKDKNGNGPLHLALNNWRSDTSIIKALLAAGADPNERNRAGETPLLVTRLDNTESFELVDILLKAGADINARNATGATILSRTMGDHSYTGRSSHKDIQDLLERGADLNIRDYKGRTLLHIAVACHQGTDASSIGYGTKLLTRFDFMLSTGMDVKMIDYRGNTLLHELASRPSILDSYYGTKFIVLGRQLLDLGLDVNQVNNQGRTALHILAATQPGSHGATTYKPGHATLLDDLIKKTSNVNQSDYQGLTPLHLAATVSEYCTEKLLNAGAQPSAPTFEGLTPLHLAARARQSNIVGLLLESIEVGRKEVIDAKDERGHTALYYACSFGRPETVQLLLNAGAGGSRKDLFDACSGFEGEDRLWADGRLSKLSEDNQSASGLTLDDKTRPAASSRSSARLVDFNDRDTSRLEEIIDLLMDHGGDVSSLSGKMKAWGSEGALNTSANVHHDYTFACLLKAQDRQPAKSSSRTSTIKQFANHASPIYRDAQLQAVTRYMHIEKEKPNQDLVVHLLKRRQYHVIETLFHKGVDFLGTDDWMTQSNMDLFVEYGLSGLLERIGSLEMKRQVGKKIWHAAGDPSIPGLCTELDVGALDRANRSHSFLLLKAIERELPNMDVVRLLVEKYHVDMNEFRYSREWLKNGKYEMAPVETALHYLSKGICWWHVALALPYLISQGANLNAKNYEGRTPLHTAIGHSNSYVGIFHKKAVRALVAAGADVNAIDEDGKSCLAHAGNDLEMVQLLMSHGANIKADSLFAAIEERQVEVLKALLSAGANPNIRRELPPLVDSKAQSRHQSRTLQDFWSVDFLIPTYEMYPLYAAAINHGSNRAGTIEEKRESQSVAVRLVETLLEYGADPYATFKRRNPNFSDGDADSGEEDEDEDGPLALRRRSAECEPEPEFEDAMILHDLLEDNELVHPILNMNGLDVDRRDAKGRTVVHVACHGRNGLDACIDSLYVKFDPEYKSSSPSLYEHLLAHGADIRATDNEGRNILHHVFESDIRYRDSCHPSLSIISRLATQHHYLVNQEDVYGKTPLHMALRHAVLQRDPAPAEALLKAGAIPSTTDKEGNNALHILAYRIYASAHVRSLFVALLNRGLDINAKNSRGETPLFNLNKYPPSIAKISVSPEDEVVFPLEAITIFESAGADLFAKDDNGRGLLHVAAKVTAKDTTGAFEALMQKGLDPMMEDFEKRTALDVAAAYGNESVLSLFGKDGFGEGRKNMH